MGNALVQRDSWTGSDQICLDIFKDFDSINLQMDVYYVWCMCERYKCFLDNLCFTRDNDVKLCQNIQKNQTQ